jgi:hypothetical protein
MPEGVGAIQHVGRRGAQRTQHSPAGEEVPNQSLARRNERVGEHVPRPSLECTLPERVRDIGGAFRSELEIVLERNGLSVEQERRLRASVEDSVDERYKPGAELREGPVPLPIPVRMHQEPDIEVLFRLSDRHTAESAGVASRLQAAIPCALRPLPRFHAQPFRLV